MNNEEWRASSAEYKALAVSSARAAVAMEEWERVAIALARHENAFFSSIEGSSSSAWQLIVASASEKFCEGLGALMTESESGWDGMSRRIAAESVSPNGQVKPKNIDMLLSGLSRNGSSPAGYWKTMGVDMILAAHNQNFRMVAPWGVSSTLGGAMWREAWLEALAASENYVRENLIDRAGEHLAVTGREAFRAISLAIEAKKPWMQIVEEYGDNFSDVLRAANCAVEAGFFEKDGLLKIFKGGSELFGGNCLAIDEKARADVWPAMIAMTSEAFASMVLAEARGSFLPKDFALLELGALELAAGRRKPLSRLSSPFRGSL